MEISKAVHQKENEADVLMQFVPKGIGINRDNVLLVAQELIEYSKTLLELSAEIEQKGENERQVES